MDFLRERERELIHSTEGLIFQIINVKPLGECAFLLLVFFGLPFVLWKKITNALGKSGNIHRNERKAEKN